MICRKYFCHVFFIQHNYRVQTAFLNFSVEFGVYHISLGKLPIDLVQENNLHFNFIHLIPEKGTELEGKMQEHKSAKVKKLNMLKNRE